MPLQIESTKEIEKLRLIPTYSNQKIELNGRIETALIFPSPGEAEFKVCCFFKDGSELCSNGDYVESGYTPTLKIKDPVIETVDLY